MAIVAIDFETYYSGNYSLSKLSEVEYILSPLFQTILVSIKEGDGPTRAYSAPDDVERALAAIDWDNTALLAHNMRFDGAILAWRYGFMPRLYLDTLSMARALTHARAGSSSLAKVAEHLGLAPKGDEVVRAVGKRREDFTEAELVEYALYCAHDTELSRAIFDRFMGSDYCFPRSELRVIDLALRCFIEPMAVLDMHKLAMHLHYVQVESERLFANEDKSTFASNDKFAMKLAEHGVNVPRKVSPTTGKITWALAKGDRAFKELCEDYTLPLAVQVMLKQRLGAKSTIEETRTQTMLNLARREWEGRGMGWCPIPYTYYAAHTGRFGGTAGFNFANLPRGSVIRDSIRAPEGWRIVHRDASQIECRTEAALAGCEPLLAGFREGRDIYSEFASRFYGRPITRDDKLERFTGKTAVLSLGYGAGAPRFRQALFIGQGGVSVNITEGEAEQLVTFYRSEFSEIPKLWEEANLILREMLSGRGCATRIPAIVVEADRIVLPNGLALQYPDLQQGYVPATGYHELTYRGPRGERKKIYGAKLIENCLGGSTEVLTDRGWVKLIDIQFDDLLWDGIAWVGHAGVISQGVQPVIMFGGILVTPDHNVYVSNVKVEAWKADYGQATAGYNRPTIQPPPRGSKEWMDRRQDGMALPLRLRLRENYPHRGTYQRQPSVVWMSQARSETGAPNSWHEQASCLRHMEQYANALSHTIEQSISTLRRAWHRCQQALGEFREFLEGHGTNLFARAYAGPARQQSWLQCGQLPLDQPTRASQQQTQQSHNRYTPRAYDYRRSTNSEWTQSHDAGLSLAGWMASGPHVRSAKLPQQEIAVFDILEAGPRHRFTVRGAGGRPFVVSNCTQALARIIVTDVMCRVHHETGYRPFMGTYDSWEYVIPEGEVHDFDQVLLREFCVAPSWLPMVPLASEGGFGRTLLDAEKGVNL